MQRSSLNLLIDLVAATLFLGMAATGYIMWFPLPPGTNKELSLWGLVRHQWGEVHFWIALALLATLLLHVCLHWNWLVTVIGQRIRAAKASHADLIRVGVLTALAFAVAFGLFAWAAQSGVQVRRDSVCSAPKLPSQTEAEHIAKEAPTETRQLTWDDVYPVLARACLSCHGPNRQRADFRVDRPADFFAPGRRLIVSGDSKASRLIAIVEDKTDIPGHKLPDSDIALLKAWIDAGAKTPSSASPVN